MMARATAPASTATTHGGGGAPRASADGSVPAPPARPRGEYAETRRGVIVKASGRGAGAARGPSVPSPPPSPRRWRAHPPGVVGKKRRARVVFSSPVRGSQERAGQGAEQGGAGRGPRGSVSRWFGDVGERDGATPASERPRGRSVLAGHGGNDARHVWVGPGGGAYTRLIYFLKIVLGRFLPSLLFWTH
jgi:hypothetical protein